MAVDKSNLVRIGFIAKDFKESWDTKSMNSEAKAVGSGGEWSDLATASDMDAMVYIADKEAKKAIDLNDDGYFAFFGLGDTYWDKEKKDFAITVNDEHVVHYENGEGIEKAFAILDGDAANEASSGSKGVNLPNSNLLLYGFTMDSNGNKVVKVGYPNRQAFSIQTDGELPATHSIGRGVKNKVDTLTPEQLEEIGIEVAEYVKEFGSKEQKASLKIYESGQPKPRKVPVLESFSSVVKRMIVKESHDDGSGSRMGQKAFGYEEGPEPIPFEMTFELEDGAISRNDIIGEHGGDHFDYEITDYEQEGRQYTLKGKIDYNSGALGDNPSKVLDYAADEIGSKIESLAGSFPKNIDIKQPEHQNEAKSNEEILAEFESYQDKDGDTIYKIDAALHDIPDLIDYAKDHENVDALLHAIDRSNGIDCDGKVFWASDIFDHMNEAKTGTTYYYVVDLDERGDFRAHVEDAEGKEVFSIDGIDDLENIRDDGFMKGKDDVDGLESHLKDMEILKANDTLTDDPNPGVEDDEEGETGYFNIVVSVSTAQVAQDIIRDQFTNVAEIISTNAFLIDGEDSFEAIIEAFKEAGVEVTESGPATDIN